DTFTTASCTVAEMTSRSSVSSASSLRSVIGTSLRGRAGPRLLYDIRRMRPTSSAAPRQCGIGPAYRVGLGGNPEGAPACSTCRLQIPRRRRRVAGGDHDVPRADIDPGLA